MVAEWNEAGVPSEWNEGNEEQRGGAGGVGSLVYIHMYVRVCVY